MATLPLERILIVHPDRDTRQLLEQYARDINEGSFTFSESSSPSEALEAARFFYPRVILMDLEHQPRLALEVVQSLRKPDRLILGIYNPITLGENENALLQDAARSGISDYITLPPSRANLENACRSVQFLGSADADPGKDNGTTVVFYSPCGGVGTTVLAVNTAFALAERQQEGEVLLVDGDLQFGDVADLFEDLPHHEITDLVQDLDHPGPLRSYCSAVPGSRLRCLARPARLYDAEKIGPEEFNRALIMLKREVHTLVVDTASALDLLTFSTLELADLIVLVTDTMQPSVLKTGRIVKLLLEEGFAPERIRVFVNRAGFFDISFNTREISNMLDHPIAASFPFDRRVVNSVDLGRPILQDHPKAKFSKSISAVVDAMMQDSILRSGKGRINR